jgi:YgiT-type zinc finger domain-containing protein
MMAEKMSSKTCHACSGIIEEGEITMTVDFGSGVVVMRNAPASVCSQCGMELIDDDTAARIEGVVNDAKANHSEVEVMSLSV